MSLDSYLAKLRSRNVAVNIVCNEGCQRRRPIDEVFFCQECGRLTCDQCAATEIDTFYCPNCLTSVLTSAAFADQNRCQKCVDCPQCFQTLTIVQLGADFAFSCEFCQWSSKSIGLIGPKAPQLTAALKAQEDAAIAPARFNDLVSLYKDLYKDAKKDPQSELQSSAPTHKPHTEHDTLESVAAIEKSLQQKAQQFYRIPAEFYINDAAKPPQQSLLDEKFDPLQVTSLEQRFSNPSTQPTAVASLLPRRKHLVTKNAYRCRQCTKYVVKPKVGAAHVAFDKRSVALSVLPIITISEIPQGTFKSKTLHKLVMYFTNPIRSDVSISIAESKVLPAEITEGQLIVADTPRLAEVSLPSGTFTMNAFDELLEQDDDDGLNRPHKDDDPEKMALRDRNRIGLRFSVIPLVQDVDIKFAVTVSLQCKVKMEFEKFQYTAEISLGQTDDSAAKQS